MQLANTSRLRAESHPFLASKCAQAAYLQLSPGDTSDDEPSNEHPCSEQWLYVISGKGEATIISAGGLRRSVRLRAGSLLLIEKGERHQVKCTGSSSLKTVNLYVPPAYRVDGSLLKSTKRKRSARKD